MMPLCACRDSPIPDNVAVVPAAKSCSRKRNLGGGKKNDVVTGIDQLVSRPNPLRKRSCHDDLMSNTPAVNTKNVTVVNSVKNSRNPSSLKAGVYPASV